ncbi:hypothetical protein SEA_ATUIN_45 [Arthrobacter phage Atuin]|nr:hypothetical protein SEA_ATUIN_144 [Arthrobacter phage Atuin]
MPFKGYRPELATPKRTCKDIGIACGWPVLFRAFIKAGTLWQCPKCGQTYYLDKNLTDTGGDRFTAWVRIK